jgi:LacI family transcriptional regulator
MPNRVTMADVAREAGVSLMTVSRALNNKDDIRPETREEIMRIVQKLGYRPSGIARSLVTKRTGTIGLIVPDVSNPYFSGIAHGVAEIANQEGLSVLLCDTEEEPQYELNFLTVLEEKQVDGVVIAAPRQKTENIAPLLARHHSVVVVNRVFDGEPGFSTSGSVINNDLAGGQMATDHLISRGHRVIGFLAGPPSSYGGQRRYQGYKASLERAGIAAEGQFTHYYCPPTVKGGREAALHLLTDYPQVTALFCFNDMVAIGAIQAGKQLGRKIPDDLAIVGYDDIPMAAWVTPPLTTCSVPFEEMGRLATHLLIERIHDCNDGCENKVLMPQLTIRASAP